MSDRHLLRNMLLIALPVLALAWALAFAPLRDAIHAALKLVVTG